MSTQHENSLMESHAEFDCDSLRLSLYGSERGEGLLGSGWKELQSASFTGHSETSLDHEFLEWLIELLGAGKETNVADGLQLIVNKLNASLGVVCRVRPESFLEKRADFEILATCGEMPRDISHREIAGILYASWEKRSTADGCIISVPDTIPRLVCCTRPISKTEVLAVGLWAKIGTKFLNSALLRIFTHLLHLALPHSFGTQYKSGTVATEHEKAFPANYVAGCSEIACHLHREVGMLSGVNHPVLIMGETGVGKEHVAQLLHSWSERRKKPFIAINCAAIPAEMLEAEMFGVGKGVATGVAERKGYFQLAEGGTLFLDEIGEMHPSLQAKLLRVLQEKELWVLGGKSSKVDVRIISATNAELRKRMDEGTFRRDLFYRLAGFELRVPPLRERMSDLALFIEHYLALHAMELGKAIKGIHPDALEMINHYHWPGNIRELSHELRRLVYLCTDKSLIHAHLLPNHIRSSDMGQEINDHALSSSCSLRPKVEDLERKLIQQALSDTGNNQSRAANLLGISRYGLTKKLHRLGLKL